jgi:hypothetical protein
MKRVSSRLFFAAVVLGLLNVAIPVPAQDARSSPTLLLESKPIRLAPHGPVRGVVRHADDTMSSKNWSGYVVTGTSTTLFTQAIGYWTVPAIECTKRPADSYVAFWVGIDGWPPAISLLTSVTPSHILRDRNRKAAS